MTAASLLEEIRERGARVEIAGDRLRIRPRSVVADLEPELRDHARELAAVVRREREEAVLWRVEVMARQVPPSGPIPVLAAREGAWLAAEGVCTSCGERFEPVSGGPFGRTLRCGPCFEATALAVEIGRRRRPWPGGAHGGKPSSEGA